MGQESGGQWLSWLISIDAVLVLSGAVLTSFVGVNGLVRRMTLDRCLPQFLLKTNRRHTTHRIIIAFFLLCVSVLLITQGELKALAGVYTISFLAVMALFGVRQHPAEGEASAIAAAGTGVVVVRADGDCRRRDRAGRQRRDEPALFARLPRVLRSGRAHRRRHARTNRDSQGLPVRRAGQHLRR